MNDRVKRIRRKESGFIGIMLTTDLLAKLDKKVAQTTLNRSQIIRLALVEYLKDEQSLGLAHNAPGSRYCICRVPRPAGGTPELGQKCLNCGGVV